MRVFALGLQAHEVDHVDHAHLEVWEVPTQQSGGRQRLEGGYIAAASQYDVGFAALVVTGELPDADAPRAVQDRLIHGQPLRHRRLAGDDDVHVVAAAQAVGGDREQAVGVWRQVHAHDLRLLVDDVVDEARVLV